MEMRKTVRVKVVGDNENLWNTLNAWNIAKWRYRRNMDFDLPATLKDSMRLFDKYNVSHLTFCGDWFQYRL